MISISIKNVTYEIVCDLQKIKQNKILVIKISMFSVYKYQCLFLYLNISLVTYCE